MPPDSILFSVVVPTKDRPALVRRALASCVSQTVQNFEVVVVDDGSADPVSRDWFGLESDRLRVLRRTDSGGCAAARNEGVAVASGEYVVFLDDDDELADDFLEHLGRAVTEETDADFFWASYRRTGSGVGSTETVTWVPRGSSREERLAEYLRRRPIGTGTGLCVDRRLFRRMEGFDEEMTCGSDAEFICRLLSSGDGRPVPRAVYLHQLHENRRLTELTPAKRDAYETLLERYAGVVSRHLRAERSLRYRVAWMSYQLGDRRRAREHLLRLLRLSPAWWKGWAVLLLNEALGRYGARAHARLSSLGKGL